MEKEKYIPLEIEIIEFEDEDIIQASEEDETKRLKAFKPFQPFEPYQIGGNEDGE